MDRREREAKDAIILRQMELIRSMTERDLRRMGTDFWGDGAAAPSGTEERKPGTGEDSGAGEASGKKAPSGGQTGPEKKEPAKDASGEQDTSRAEQEPPESMEDLLAELDGYIGLAAVKREVRDLVNLVRVHQLRRQNQLPVTELSLHMVFSGNPGTGKTTVARLMARIYRSLGILSKGQLVEVDRSGLVAGYVGQTALKTAKVIEKALGGVLFVDEAYALRGSGENDFGQEAIDTILKAMEDHRDDLVVIVAGYDDLMGEFIRSNPGLESRFNRFLHFDDYSADELTAIFRGLCRKGCYTLCGDADVLVRQLIERENRDGVSFGNARGVRNLFEKILVCQANRLASAQDVDRQALTEILPQDVRAAAGEEPLPEPPGE